MLAMVVPPYLNSNLPPTSETLKFVVWSSGVLAAVPVVFWFNVGNVQFAKLPEAGVPKLGVISVGVSDNTTAPEPVEIVEPVPPLPTGKIPVTCEVKFTFDNVPPRVKLPELVTVPVRVSPLTVPVPPTEVTVPPEVVAAMV